MGTRRFVYNKVLAKIKFEQEKINAIELRDKYVTFKSRNGEINPNVEDWENEVPSDIREEAIRDLVKNHKTSFSNLKNGNITGFKMNFCSKKDNPSMAVPLSAIGATNTKIDKNIEELAKVKSENKSLTRKQVEITKNDNGFNMYPKYLPGKLKIKKRQLRKKFIIDGTCRIKLENNVWSLIAPYKTKSHKEGDLLERKDYCALDPGVRTFQTVYSEQSITQIKIRKELIAKLLIKLDKLRSLRKKKIIKGATSHRRIHRRLDNLIDDLHHKTASYLTKNYNVIFLPPFESQKMVKRSRNSNLNRSILQLKHFQFRKKLESKCQLTRCRLFNITEEYTSKTCGVCGELNDIGGDEVYHCRVCGLRIDRDVNGARNIMIKSFKELYC
jgi:transposase